MTEADRVRQPTCAPVRRATRRRFERADDHLFHLLIRDRSLSRRAAAHRRGHRADG